MGSGQDAAQEYRLRSRRRDVGQASLGQNGCGQCVCFANPGKPDEVKGRLILWSKVATMEMDRNGCRGSVGLQEVGRNVVPKSKACSSHNADKEGRFMVSRFAETFCDGLRPPCHTERAKVADPWASHDEPCVWRKYPLSKAKERRCCKSGVRVGRWFRAVVARKHRQQAQWLGWPQSLSCAWAARVRRNVGHLAA